MMKYVHYGTEANKSLQEDAASWQNFAAR